MHVIIKNNQLCKGYITSAVDRHSYFQRHPTKKIKKGTHPIRAPYPRPPEQLQRNRCINTAPIQRNPEDKHKRKHIKKEAPGIMLHSHGGNKVVSWPKRAKKTSVRGNIRFNRKEGLGNMGKYGRKKMKPKVINRLRERVGISGQRNQVEH